MLLVLSCSLAFACGDDGATATETEGGTTDTTVSMTSPSTSSPSTTDVSTTSDTDPVTSSSDDTTMGGSVSTSLGEDSGSASTAEGSTGEGDTTAGATDTTATGSGDATAVIPDTTGGECGLGVYGDAEMCGVQVDCPLLDEEMACTIDLGTCICIQNGENIGGCDLPEGLCDMGMGAYFEHAETCCGIEI